MIIILMRASMLERGGIEITIIVITTGMDNHPHDNTDDDQAYDGDVDYDDDDDSDDDDDGEEDDDDDVDDDNDDDDDDDDDDDNHEEILCKYQFQFKQGDLCLYSLCFPLSFKWIP